MVPRALPGVIPEHCRPGINSEHSWVWPTPLPQLPGAISWLGICYPPANTNPHSLGLYPEFLPFLLWGPPTPPHSMMVPGNAAGVAKQFLRCIFHQLAPNGIFPQLFQSTIKGQSCQAPSTPVPQKGTWTPTLMFSLHLADGTFLRTLASSLMDFNELSSIAALSQLLEVGLCGDPTMNDARRHFMQTQE